LHIIEVLFGEAFLFGGDHGDWCSTCQSQLTILEGCYFFVLFLEVVAQPTLLFIYCSYFMDLLT
jgi:hypothetical protein